MSTLDPKYVDPPLPTHLKTFVTDVDDITQEEEDAKWAEAWHYFEPTLNRAGYSITWNTPEDGIRGCRRSALWPPAKDPFNPKKFESFVGYAIYPPFSITSVDTSAWMRPTVHVGMDSYERDVYFKLVAPYQKSREVEIWTFLDSPDLRKDPRNHTLPLLDRLQYGEWVILVSPTWDQELGMGYRAHIKDYLDIGDQLLEGLYFMHEHGIVHRDISTGNIRFNHCDTRSAYNALDLTGFKPAYAFMDFGISDRYPEGRDGGILATGCVGSHYFLAPEVLKAEKDTSATYDPFPVDVYALGRVLKRHLLRDIEYCAPESTPTQMDIPSPALALVTYAPAYLDLLDSLTSSDPLARPTAEVALRQLRQITSQMSEDTLLQPTPPMQGRMDLLETHRLLSRNYARIEYGLNMHHQSIGLGLKA